MDRTYGFRILDDPQYREAFDRGLRKVGYQLGDWHIDEPLITQLDVPIIPLGNSRPFVLRLTHDAYQEWAYGALFDSAELRTELAEFDFNPRSKYEQSCYSVWLADIVNAVRVATRR